MRPLADGRWPDTKWDLRIRRAGYALLAFGAFLVVVVARALDPADGGRGTHEQLGLPPCTFDLLTGHGCPGCGMTTAFAYMARGELAAAFGANPLGPVLFALVALLVPVAAHLALCPVPLDSLMRSRYFTIGLGAVLVAMVTVWLIRLSLGLV